MRPSPNQLFCLQIQKKKNQSPNGSIRKVNWLESKSEHFLQNLSTTGVSLAQSQNIWDICSPKALANRAQVQQEVTVKIVIFESSNLHLTCCENRMLDASSVLKILPVKGVLFSTSVEVRVLIPSVVRLCPSTNSGSVREHFSRRTALRIFLIFCMNVPYYKGKKRTRRFFRENSCSLIIHKNVFFHCFKNF